MGAASEQDTNKMVPGKEEKWQKQQKRKKYP